MSRIKGWMLAGLMVVVAPAAMGSALVTKGSNELAVDGKLDFATELGTDVNLKLKYAYFVLDRFAVGARVSGKKNDSVRHYGLGLTMEYNFALPASYKPVFGTDLVPFLGGGVDYRHAKLFDEKEDAAVFIGEAGLKFFLTDMTAVTLSLVGELATEEIYADDFEATDKDLSLQLGMRMYF